MHGGRARHRRGGPSGRNSGLTTPGAGLMEPVEPLRSPSRARRQGGDHKERMGMAPQFARYVAEQAPGLAEGWTLQRLTQPSRLYGANGMRTGADGRIYVAQVSGSQISAIDPETGAVEAVSPMGGDIVAPDDLVFDPAGNIYATEITEGRVSMRTPKGETRVI